MPDYAWVTDTDGREYAVVRSALNPEIHTEVEGAVVVLDHYGRPVLQPEPASAPSKSASKAEWVAYAVTQGMDPEQAEAATKADLIAEYGTEKEN